MNDLEEIRHWKDVLNGLSWYQIRKACKPYSFYKELSEDIDTLILKNTIEEDKNHSVPLEKVKPEIMRIFGLQDWQFEISKGKNGIEIAIITPNIGQNCDYVEKEMNEFGYFLSRSGNIEAYGIEWAVLRFEPKFQDRINNIVRNCGILFHVTPIKNLASIMAQGLKPSSSNKMFKYPGRIYFLMGNVRHTDIIKTAKILSKYEGGGDEYYLLTISVKEIPNNVDFYYDPNLTDSVYTTKKIPRQAISNVEKLRL